MLSTTSGQKLEALKKASLLSKLRYHSILPNWWDKLVLLAILIFICYRNFTPNTFLVGWDNLMPELNIWLNIKRSIFAVWQSYQGLGLVGGMAHSTDLVRQLIILPFVYLLPQNFIRYFWQFSMLFLGSFSLLTLLQSHLRFKKIPSLVASLFYLLNFGTIQIFYPPFEPFSTFWGFFPLLIFSLIKFLEYPRPRQLFTFIIINFLAIPSYYVQTIFFVYLLIIIPILLHKKNLKPLFQILFINAFWLLPLFYFISTNLNTPQQAFGNIMASENTLLRNQAHGNIKEFLLLRNYYYDFPDSGQFLMQSWHEHFNNNYILWFGYIPAFFAILGLFFIKKLPSRFRFPLLWIFFLSSLTLLNAVPPFSILNNLFRSVPVINQIFRSPFTKFIIPTIFSFSLLLGLCLNNLPSFTNFITAIAIIIFALPVFKGFLFYPKMRQAIPKEYFQTFSYFNSQNPSSRIMNLPSGSFWGWTNYRFGIRGSGFLWYAIPQPILDRAFDVWSLKNEQYFWELNYALNQNDPVLIEQILKKYYIEYIIFDDNVYFPDEKIYSKMALSTQNLLSKIPSLKLEKQFGSISIYRYPKQKTFFTSLLNNTNKPFYYYDPAFSTSPYIDNNNNLYPNLNLFTNRFPYDKNPFEHQNISLTVYPQFKKPKTITLNGNDLVNPRACSPVENDSYFQYYFSDKNLIMTAKNSAICADIKDLSFLKSSTPLLLNIKINTSDPSLIKYCLWDGAMCINNKDFFDPHVLVPPQKTPHTFSIILDNFGEKNLVTSTIQNILITYEPINFLPKQQINIDDIDQVNSPEKLKKQINKTIFSPSVYALNFEKLNLSQSYLLEIDYKHLQGQSLDLSVFSTNQQHYYLKTNLSKNSNKAFLLIPAIKNDLVSSGITLLFDTANIPGNQSVNLINYIKIYPVPLETLINTTSSKSENINGNFIILPQSFDKGWITYPPSKHYLFNGWANAFEIKDKRSTIYDLRSKIFFVPQILQFIGFFVTLLILYRSRRRLK